MLNMENLAARVLKAAVKFQLTYFLPFAHPAVIRTHGGHHSVNKESIVKFELDAFNCRNNMAIVPVHNTTN